MMKLPKLYAPTRIKFWGLRNGLGANFGVIFDIDTLIERTCRRVLCNGGWIWQIVDYVKLSERDDLAECDKE